MTKRCFVMVDAGTMEKLFLIVTMFFLLEMFSQPVFAQSDTTHNQRPEVSVAGFVDVFYAYDFNRPQSNFRQPFLYNHNRHNEYNLNLGFVKVAVKNLKYRANLAIQAGTYANDNYVSEPGVLKNLFEANAGFSLNKKNNLWLDAGIFGSHLGIESAISIDNWTLTRSLFAENSPYYLSGAKLTYNPNPKWELAAVMCNGWQRIQRVQGNSMPSFGTQIKITASEKMMVNWSTFIGTDDPDATRRMRYFSDLYGQFLISDKVGFIAGFDIGAQQQANQTTSYNVWFTPFIIARYTINSKWASALRGEYYQDKSGVIIQTGTANGFKTSGFSLNVDYFPASNIAVRLEGRLFTSEDMIFVRYNTFKNDNFALVSSIAIKF